MPDLDLQAIGRSVVRLRAEVPEDAFTAGVLGSQRTGNGVVIGPDGLVLTIGYLVTEARDVWLTTPDGREVAGHPLAYDQVTGFGLVVPLQKLNLAPIPFGVSSDLVPGSRAYVVSAPEFAEPQPVQILARREFAGYWEYLLDDAIFTSPAHPHWSGAALVDAQGRLVGSGSLLLREELKGREVNANMFVPIDLLKPILEDMRTKGHTSRAPRPWLGLYAVEMTGNIYVTGVAEGGPAHKADLREGDLISQVADHEVATLPDFYRRLWAIGPAGTGVPLTAIRGGTRLELNVRSVDRSELLKRPQAN
ncbi:MAG TPA: S1C family serine protease [Steroidobacteraceae bacterium]|jgi:S1-C subfamily serine protease|nr:S1C family serine protease [Steroidobacteraceae bacterium]